MKNKAFLFVFAAFCFAAAAPVQNEDALEVLLQGGLEDNTGSHHEVLDPTSPDEELPFKYSTKHPYYRVGETQRFIKVRYWQSKYLSL